jgi:C_GCAxxG_C_C family probable redox protein
MNKKEEAMQLHDKKYNCAQAVACAFAKEAGVDEKLLFAANEGYGLGMGGTKGVCGALTGAIMLAGLKNSDANLDNPATKGSTYQISRQMLDAFEAKTGSTICKDLKGLETGQVLCSCDNCIRAGVEVVEEFLGL